MKSYFKELHYEVPARRAFVNITADVERFLKGSGIKDDLPLCNALPVR